MFFPHLTSGILRGILVFMTLLCLTGCSSFNRDWKQMRTNPTPDDPITGRWDGSWISDQNGHTGRLRALITKGTGAEYQARFHAKFFKIFSYGYSIPMKVMRGPDLLTFEGQADLGWLAGGIYRCHGTATATNFHALYTSKRDHGKLLLTRPAGE
jgi:hypothetical protein